MRLRKASAVIEFTLVGVPLIFILISTFEMARGIWTYHTLAYAVKEGTRYAVVHGANCALIPNACTRTLGQVATRIKDSAIGMDPAQFNLTFTPSSGAAVTCALANCVSLASMWPPADANNPGVDVQISGTYPFNTIVAMFWPGAGSTVFGSYNLLATSRERIQF